MDIETEIVYEKSDGEVSSDSEASYTPLERPLFLHQEKVSASKVTSDNLSDENLSNISDSSLSDSDSDHCIQSKKAKTKLKLNKRLPSLQKKQNKYSIWNARAQEDLLTETMITCGVTQVDRSRDVESYNFPKRNKRSFDDRSNVHLRLGKRNDPNNDNIKADARILLDLAVTVDNTDEEVAIDIANKLLEQKDELLKRLVEYAGKNKAIELYNETKRIEADGGMLVMNETRRRTPGGVYFFLLKRDDDITENQKKMIFQVERQMANKAKRKLKRKTNSSKKVTAASNNLPNLLSRAEIELAKGNRERKESDHTENVSNPPPSPVTDGKENSSDEMTDNPDHPPVSALEQKTTLNSSRNIQSYDEDFLEIEYGNDMDFFS